MAGQLYFIVPLGKTCTTALRCICTSTPVASSTAIKASPSLETRPRKPPAVTTSSPLTML